jgi:hypothetical protein
MGPPDEFGLITRRRYSTTSCRAPPHHESRRRRGDHRTLIVTLGNAIAARVRLIVWCKACRDQVEPDPAE